MPECWENLKSDEVIERDWVTDSRPKVKKLKTLPNSMHQNIANTE